MAPRLPTVGSDLGAWGSLLNTYLSSLVNGGQIFDVAAIYGQGQADDAANVQSAVNTVGAAGGGDVLLRPGQWNWGSGVSIAYNNVRLRGTGWGTVIRLNSGFTG